MHSHPVPAVLAVVIHEGTVLLVRRSNQPDRGLWGFPGGHLDLGETLFVCAERETREETGVEVAARAHLTALEVVRRDAEGRIAWHFVLLAVACDYVGGQPVAADDVSEAGWVPLADVVAGRLAMSADVARVAALALARRGDGAGWRAS